jgi:hypothetical protein
VSQIQMCTTLLEDTKMYSPRLRKGVGLVYLYVRTRAPVSFVDMSGRPSVSQFVCLAAAAAANFQSGYRNATPRALEFRHVHGRRSAIGAAKVQLTPQEKKKSAPDEEFLCTQSARKIFCRKHVVLWYRIRSLLERNHICN